MKTGRTARPREFTRHNYVVMAGILTIAAAIAVVPLYSVQSSSSPNSGATSRSERRANGSLLELSRSGLRLAQPPSTESIATFGAGCTTAKTSFSLNDPLCVSVTGVPTTGTNVVISDPDNFERARFDVTASSQSFSYNLPDLTMTGSVDNRGTWAVALVNVVDNSRRLFTTFSVHDPAQQVADVTISKTSLDVEMPTAGSNATYRIYVTNQGPDSAANVSFTDNTLPNTTFVSFVEDGTSTFSCTPPSVGSAGSTVCSKATMTVGETASFTATYLVNSSVGDGSNLSDTTTVTTDTFDSHEDSNTSSVDTTDSNPTPPTCSLTCPDNITANADTVEDVEGTPTSGKHVSFAATTSGTCGTESSTPASGSFFPVGSTPVTITASGGGSCSFIVTVTESGSPVSITCPSNKTANADSDCQVTVAVGTPTTTGDNVTVTQTRSDGRPLSDPFSAGVTTITWTASNSSGTESCTQTVTVLDVTPPVINVPAQAASADANCQAAVPDLTASSGITDNCACDNADDVESCVGHPHVAVTQSPAPGTIVGLGVTTITLTANDGSSNNGGAGNTTVAEVAFTVSDTTPPAFTFVPAAITAYTGSGSISCDAVVDPGTATAADNCGPITITRSPAGNTFPVGTTTITWTAKDGANNTTSASQSITVIDNTAPVISCPSNITVYLPLHTTATSMAVNYPAATATDNCGVANIGYTIASGSVFPVGTTSITATATDVHGNSASCSFTVTVLYDFTGFFAPVNNVPTLNVVNAGRAIPVKFSLSGNKGLSIFTVNSPQSGLIPCDASAPATDLTDTVTAGNSSLSYDASSDQYVYTWKTENSWAGTCRQLVVTLNDGSVHVANFKFK